MAVPGDAFPRTPAPVWTHPLLRGVSTGPLAPKLGGLLDRLARLGWSDSDMNEYLARVGRVTGAYHAVIAADYCADRMPGISPPEVAAWVLLLHDPGLVAGAETPTEALYFWLDEAGPAPVTDFARAAAGDYELARLALTAGISAEELRRHVAAGTVDRDMLRLLAALR
jgi:hypothetical protein